MNDGDHYIPGLRRAKEYPRIGENFDGDYYFVEGHDRILVRYCKSRFKAWLHLWLNPEVRRYRKWLRSQQ